MEGNGLYNGLVSRLLKTTSNHREKCFEIEMERGWRNFECNFVFRLPARPF